MRWIIELVGIDSVEGDKIFKVTQPDGEIFFTPSWFIEKILSNDPDILRYPTFEAYEKYWSCVLSAILHAEATVRVIPVSEWIERGILAAH